MIKVLLIKELWEGHSRVQNTYDKKFLNCTTFWKKHFWKLPLLDLHPTNRNGEMVHFHPSKFWEGYFDKLRMTSLQVENLRGNVFLFGVIVIALNTFCYLCSPFFPLYFSNCHSQLFFCNRRLYANLHWSYIQGHKTSNNCSAQRLLISSHIISLNTIPPWNTLTTNL